MKLPSLWQRSRALGCVVRRSEKHSGELQMFVEEGNIFLLAARKSGCALAASARRGV